MIGIVVVSCGKVALEMKRSAEILLGRKINHLRQVSVDPKKGLSGSKGNLTRAIKDVDDGDGVLILADLYGSTPCNICMPYIAKHRVELVSGMNLPMLVKAVMVRESIDFGKFADFLVEYGKGRISLLRECPVDNGRGSASKKQAEESCRGRI